MRLMVAGLVLGIVVGLVWWLVTPSPELVVREEGIFPVSFADASWFAADGWFVTLTAIAGVILAALGWRWGKSAPLVTLAGLALAGALVAISAWWLGGFVGPDEPATVSVSVGDTMLEPLGLRALGVLFTPSIVALLGFVLTAAAVPATDPDQGPTVPVESFSGSP
jgi:hypothetical protein